MYLKMKYFLLWLFSYFNLFLEYAGSYTNSNVYKKKYI